MTEAAADRPARIRFTLPAGVPAARLPLTLRAAADGQYVEIRTGRPQVALTELLRWANDSGVELAGLDVRSGPLEEAFREWLARTGDPGPARRCPAGASSALARIVITVFADLRRFRREPRGRQKKERSGGREACRS